jgi:hypothetical protein
MQNVDIVTGQRIVYNRGCILSMGPMVKIEIENRLEEDRRKDAILGQDSCTDTPCRIQSNATQSQSELA